MWRTVWCVGAQDSRLRSEVVDGDERIAEESVAAAGEHLRLGNEDDVYIGAILGDSKACSIISVNVSLFSTKHLALLASKFTP